MRENPSRSDGVRVSWRRFRGWIRNFGRAEVFGPEPSRVVVEPKSVGTSVIYVAADRPHPGRSVRPPEDVTRPQRPRVPADSVLAGHDGLLGLFDPIDASAAEDPATPPVPGPVRDTVTEADELDPDVVAPLDPRDAAPPRFASGSRAARLPWLLTVDPSSPPGLAADQAELGDLTVRAASIVGPSHRCEQPTYPRQDAYRLARDSRARFLIAAVADGMADSRRSELGAQVAVARAVGVVRSQLDQGRPADALSASEVFAEVAQDMVAAAQGRRLKPGDVRTTLTVLVLPTAADGTGFRPAWVGRIADTHVWINDGNWKRVTGDVKPALDGNVLREFLPHVPEAAVDARFLVPDGAAVGVLSDGIGDALDDVAGASRWFARRWATPPPLASFLLDIDFEARGHQDDRTAVVVWCGARAKGER